jgi:N-carbamoyl-L-amino-acid hydrolase
LALQPQRVVAELRELAELTGDSRGAQRVCWTDTWARARAWLRDKLLAIGAEVEVDEAGNQWATLRGHSQGALLIGGHIDSVPDGGWLDGSLNLVAGLEVLRRIAAEGQPPIDVALVDWADEEGARFGVSLFGSSAASGHLDLASISGLADSAGRPISEVLAGHGVQLQRAGECQRRLRGASAYLELHIEQGPVLEERGLPLGVVAGTFGAERHAVRFLGQAAHAGSTPMLQRRDALLAGARLSLAVRELAIAEGGVGTVGTIGVRPAIVNAVPGRCDLTLDQRHLDPEALERMLQGALDAARDIAAEERCEVSIERLWRIDPIPFDGDLLELADRAVEEVAGTSLRLASGPLHDAAEVARAGVPTVMLFVQSLRGLSHTPEEDTLEAHIEMSVEALDRLAAATLERLAS